jgi:hypothetical protein
MSRHLADFDRKVEDDHFLLIQEAALNKLRPGMQPTANELCEIVCLLNPVRVRGNRFTPRRQKLASHSLRRDVPGG